VRGAQVLRVRHLRQLPSTRPFAERMGAILPKYRVAIALRLDLPPEVIVRDRSTIVERVNAYKKVFSIVQRDRERGLLRWPLLGHGFRGRKLQAHLLSRPGLRRPSEAEMPAQPGGPAFDGSRRHRLLRPCHFARLGHVPHRQRGDGGPCPRRRAAGLGARRLRAFRFADHGSAKRDALGSHHPNGWSFTVRQRNGVQLSMTSCFLQVESRSAAPGRFCTTIQLLKLTRSVADGSDRAD